MKEMGHNQRFTNVYIKNFGEEFTDELLMEAFQPFGKIVSAKVCHHPSWIQNTITLKGDNKDVCLR